MLLVKQLLLFNEVHTMTENEYRAAMKQIVITVIVGLVAVYGFFIPAIIFDIH